MQQDKTAPMTAPIDFTALVLSLGSSALIHLGIVKDPSSGAVNAPDLPLAQQSIDLLALLQEKTRGNLTAEEERFLEQMLFDLRMRFVDSAVKPHMGAAATAGAAGAAGAPGGKKG
ncbi:MAG TPA: DUF1844 domain-containing protein [Myxococcales bacterium]|jgi:hypothetical protein|nr:DUF1844 domain-containing protein [Myxococcales bacterium]